jgi:DNA adenine methylase
MDSYRPVAPLRPVAPYVGGKKRLAARLVESIESVPHATYAEAFVGMGGVFLRRRFAPRAEAINDYSGDVANFFRVLREHYAPLMDLLRYRFTSRREFERLAAVDPATLTSPSAWRA